MLNFHPLLKKGTFHRVRGFQAHVKSHPGSWYGIDDGCVVGTQGYAPEDGKVTNKQKISTGGGWNFRFYPTKYPAYFFWLAHNSALPTKTTYKRGEKMFKTGATGGVDGPHLHYSLLKGTTPLDPDKVVKWIVEDPMADATQIFKNVFITIMARWPTATEVSTFLKNPEKRPYTYVQKKYLPTRYVSKTTYNTDIAALKATIDKKILDSTADAANQYQNLLNEQRNQFEKTVSDLQGELGA